jgi:hypothetical protein
MARKQQDPSDEDLNDLASFADLPLLEQLKEVHGDLLTAKPPGRLLDVLNRARKASKDGE